ncbi:hypothetical protein GOP47_0014577 [Adiantum capillus-veneris]|uniref:CBM20 domain-containing protein n=1 Tax=Adiantum capillus-veneris TaxID=13818 RepID=A0A9D4ULR5_ADICA|nr:hypothetical protein GOP47_0014577 [Adiantum capillus-veneris]
MDIHVVSIKLNDEQQLLPAHLVPFVYGSSPLLGSWDPTKAIEMTQTEELTWELELAVPPQYEELEFNFLVRDLDGLTIWKIEEHQKRRLLPANKAENTRACAKFRNLKQIEEVELPVYVHVESIPPSSVAAMWKAHKGGLKVSTNQENARNNGVYAALSPEDSFSTSLKRQIQNHNLVDDEVAAECNAEDVKTTESQDQLLLISARQPPEPKPINNMPYKSIASTRSVSVQDLVVLGSEPEKLQGVQPAMGDCAKPVFFENPSMFTSEDRLMDNNANIDCAHADGSTQDKNVLGLSSTDESSPKISWHTCLLADQLLVPKERRRLAIIMVGLPARGKTFTATKLTRYLRWLGHKTKHFNVGQYRRLKHGCNQNADFFRSDNQGGLDARNEIAALAMDDMLMWMQEGGQIGIFDATNSTKQRRSMLLKRAEGKCKVIFLEILCNDRSVIERNIRLKIQQSPDYVDMPDFEESLNDFKSRLANYEKAYEPVAEGSYIKMMDTVGGEGGQVQINNIGGYLPGRILFFLVNTHTNPRPIFLTRPGESLGSVLNLVGGDKNLSATGEIYSKLLADFVNERLKTEHTASVWMSTLQRTIATVQHLTQFPKVQWRALDDISAGICDGMTYDEIKSKMPEEYKARSLDKLRYRYPRGESYLDVIQRLEPVIIELERQHSPVIIVAHQAVLRSLYGYFADKPLEQIPYIEIPMHTVIEVQMGVAGVEEKRYKLL